MGKSKAQRKQEKKASMQDNKKVQEQVEPKKQEQKPEEKKPEVKTPEKKSVGPEQVKLTMYTLIYMVVTFISGCVTVVAMVVYAKPISNVLKVTVGSTINDYSYEAVEQVLFEDYPDMPIYGLYLGIALLVAASAVVTVIGLIRAVDEYNKPGIITTILGFVFAVGAFALFIYENDYTIEKIRLLAIPENPQFGIYKLYFPFLIANIVGMLCNIISTIIGLARWKKTGKTSK